MSDETFINKVTRYFGYLETEYMFKIVLAKNSTVRPQTDGIVKFGSNTTLVIVDSETGQASVRFIRIHDAENYYLDPVSLHEYLNTSEKEKETLLSKNVNDKDAANAIFNKTFLLSLPHWKSDSGDFNVPLERQLKNYASWLKANASLCLTGDFSRWPEFYEYKISRLAADEIRRGGKEFVKAIVKDEKGALKTIERPIFQKERDHLARLRKEIIK